MDKGIADAGKNKLDYIDVSGEPPVKEPDRQYYFMAKLKKTLAEKSIELGRPLTCCVTTFGRPKV